VSLSTIRDRVEQTLLDTSNDIWDTDAIDEAIRVALDMYSAAWPNRSVQVYEQGGDSREITLEEGTLAVLEVWWPYDEDAPSWPPNQVRGWRQVDMDGAAYLYLTSFAGGEPKEGDKVRVWFTTRQTILNLDSASATTIGYGHQSLIVTGAAGQAALSRAADLVETTNVDLYQVGLLASWGKLKMREFTSALEGLRAANARRGAPWSEGWQLDKWEGK
jgi:hypothetical protein